MAWKHFVIPHANAKSAQQEQQQATGVVDACQKLLLERCRGGTGSGKQISDANIAIRKQVHKVVSILLAVPFVTPQNGNVVFRPLAELLQIRGTVAAPT